MPKGKKFDAAEKHFAGIKADYEKKIKFYKSENAKLSDEIKNLKIQNDAVEEQLKYIRKCLEEVKDMSSDEIRQLIEHYKNSDSSISLAKKIVNMGNFGGMY